MKIWQELLICRDILAKWSSTGQKSGEWREQCHQAHSGRLIQAHYNFRYSASPWYTDLKWSDHSFNFLYVFYIVHQNFRKMLKSYASQTSHHSDVVDSFSRMASTSVDNPDHWLMAFRAIGVGKIRHPRHTKAHLSSWWRHKITSFNLSCWAYIFCRALSFLCYGHTSAFWEDAEAIHYMR